MNASNHKSAFVNVHGIRLHYLDWGGSGETLLFLTGMGSSAYIFSKFALRFADKFRVLALTRRGHGDSDYPETGYDADTLTEDIRGFMDHLHIQKAILAGHSLAGVELTHFAATHPTRVEKLIYLDALDDRRGLPAMREQNPLRHVEIKKVEARIPTLSFYARRKPRLSNVYTEEQKTLFEQFYREVEEPFSRSLISEFQSRFPHAKIVVIPDGHHYCFIAQEELVYNEMRKFLLD